MPRNTAKTFLLAFALSACAVTAADHWTDWADLNGSGGDLEYRWQKTGVGTYTSCEIDIRPTTDRKGYRIGTLNIYWRDSGDESATSRENGVHVQPTTEGNFGGGRVLVTMRGPGHGCKEITRIRAEEITRD